MDEVPSMYPNLCDQTDFRLNRINETKDYFIAEIRERELMSKSFSKYIDFFSYFDKSLIVLSPASGGVFIASFASVNGASIGIPSASFTFTFSLTTGIVKNLLKTTRHEKKKHNKISMLVRSKLSSIENTISKALIDNEVSHEDLTAIIKEERNYPELKEIIRIIKSQRSDIERNKLIEGGKRIDIEKIIRQNEMINNETMLFYRIKYAKNTEKINPIVSKISDGKIMLLSKCAICGSKKSRFIKKQEASGLLSSLGIKTPLSKIPILGDILF